MSRLSKYNVEDELKKAIADASRTNPLIIFDLETTGLSRKSDKILSFSAIKAIWNGYGFEEIDRMNVFINPGFHIPPHITSINHISDDTVKECGHEEDVIPQIKNFIGSVPLFCGYNSNNFDIPFLNAVFGRVLGEGVQPVVSLDVMRLAKSMCHMDNYKLEYVASQLGIGATLSFHNSIDDIIATLCVLNELVRLKMFSKEEPKSELIRLEVHGCNLFKKSHFLNRIYINTFPYSKSYYDVYRGEWHSDLYGVNMELLRKDALKYMNVKDEKEFAKIMHA